MRRMIALAATIALAVITVNAPAKADEEDWFKRHDYDHDARWNYKEFRKAHYQWYKAHPNEARWNERRLHEEFNRCDLDHDGYVHCDEVRGVHHW